MRTILLLLLVASLGGCSQKAAYTSLKKATITDAGELYSNYDWSADEREQVKGQLKDPAQVTEIEKYSKDSDWPENMKDFEWRIANPTKIQSFNVRIVANMGDDKYILVVPMAENKSAPVKLTRDIYIVIRKIAVKAS